MVVKAAGGVPWSKARRKRLHWYRTEHRLDFPDAAIRGPGAWQALQASYAREDATRIFEPGPGHEAPLAAALDSLSGGEPPSALDPDVELYRAAVVQQCQGGQVDDQKWETWAHARALVGYWLDLGGLEGLLDVLFRAPRFARRISISVRGGGADAQRTERVTFVDVDDPGQSMGPYGLHPGVGTASTWQPLLWAVRAWLHTLPAREFEAMLPDLEAARAKHGSFRSALAFAFARDPRWAREDLAAWQKGEGGIDQTLLAASLDRAEDVQAAVDGKALYGLATYAFDLVETLGAEAAPILRGIVAARPATKAEERPFVNAATLADKGVAPRGEPQPAPGVSSTAHVSIGEAKENRMSDGTDLAAKFFDGKAWLIYGKMSLTKKELKAAIEARGGRVIGSVSGKLDFLVHGGDTLVPGENARGQVKPTGALRVGAACVNDEDFKRLLEGEVPDKLAVHVSG